MQDDRQGLIRQVHALRELLASQRAWLLVHDAGHAALPTIQFLEQSCRDALVRMQSAGDHDSLADVGDALQTMRTRIAEYAAAGIGGIQGDRTQSGADVLAAVRRLE